jgi:hypothetical protein
LLLLFNVYHELLYCFSCVIKKPSFSCAHPPLGSERWGAGEGARESRRTLSGTAVLFREYHSRSSERALTGIRHPAPLLCSCAHPSLLGSECWGAREGVGESRRTLFGTVVLSREYHSRSSERALTGICRPCTALRQDTADLLARCSFRAECGSFRELTDSLMHCSTAGVVQSLQLSGIRHSTFPPVLSSGPKDRSSRAGPAYLQG